MVMSKVRLLTKIRRLGEATNPERSAGRPDFAHYTPAFALNPSKKAWKNPLRLVEKCQLVTIHYVDMATFRQVVLTSLSNPVFLRPVPTLGQRRYLPSCRTKGSPYHLTLSRIFRLVLMSAKSALSNHREFLMD
jgi:hypothetical protein